MAIGYAIFLSTNNALTMTNISANIRGSISGVLNLSRNLGLLAGASLMSTVFVSTTYITNTAVANSQMVELGLHAVYQLAVVLLIGVITIQIINKSIKRLNF